MTITSDTKVGIIPTGLRPVINNAVQKACDDWVEATLVAPNEMTLELEGLRRKSTVTDDDIVEALSAAKEAARRNGTA